MRLVIWSEGSRDGVGRSGTRYSIHYSETPVIDRGPRCRIAVDDEEICAVDSVEAAMGRAEHFEALRCFLFGLAADLSNRQLDQADAVAGEMATAAEQSLDRADLSSDERATIEQSAAALRSIRHRIRAAQEGRRRGVDASTVLH
jgi:hypothetical protein